MKKGILTTVEINDSHVKLLQAKYSRGKFVLHTCRIKSIAKQTDDEVVNILSDFGLYKGFHSEELLIIIPRRFIILKHLRLPSQNEGEIRQMIGLQLVNKIPYLIEDVVYDFRILEKEDSGYVQVLVYVAHKDVCTRYINIFNNLGIHLSRLTVSSLGLLEFFNVYEENNKIDPNLPVALVNIDSSNSEICFCHNRKLLFSRSVLYGVKDLKDDNMMGLIKQIDLTLGSYLKEGMGPEIKKIFLFSDIKEIINFKDKLESELKVAVEIVNSSDNVLSQKDLNLTTLKDSLGLSLNISLGFFSCELKKLVNLTPPEIHDTKKTKIIRAQILQFAFLFVLIFALIASIFGIELYRKNLFLEQIEEKIKETKPIIKKIDERKDFIKFYKEIFVTPTFMPDIIYEVYNLIPEAISVRSIDIDSNGAFSIQGYAETSSSVNNFQEKLVKSKTFKDVRLEFATKRKIFNIEVTDFKISSQLAGKDKAL